MRIASARKVPSRTFPGLILHMLVVPQVSASQLALLEVTMRRLDRQDAWILNSLGGTGENVFLVRPHSLCCCSSIFLPAILQDRSFRVDSLWRLLVMSHASGWGQSFINRLTLIGISIGHAGPL